MSVDVSKIRPGDEVTIYAKVESVDFDRKIVLVTTSRHDRWSVGVRDIFAHKLAPREIAVGDEVTWGDGLYFWKVEALSGQKAWLSRSGSFATKRVDTLRHAS